MLNELIFEGICGESMHMVRFLMVALGFVAFFSVCGFLNLWAGSSDVGHVQ